VEESNSSLYGGTTFNSRVEELRKTMQEYQYGELLPGGDSNREPLQYKSVPAAAKLLG
jgi:hypothetical protein